MGGVDLILLAAGKCSLLCTFSLHFLSHWSHPELFLSLCPCVQLHVNIRTVTIVTYIITIPKLGSSVKYRLEQMQIFAYLIINEFDGGTFCNYLP